MSRATITDNAAVRAIRDSVRRVAREILADRRKQRRGDNREALDPGRPGITPPG